MIYKAKGFSQREIHSIIDLKVGGWGDSLCGAFEKEMSLWKIVVGGPPSKKGPTEDRDATSVPVSFPPGN